MLCFLRALREFEAEDLQFLQKVKLTKSIPNNVSGLSDEKGGIVRHMFFLKREIILLQPWQIISTLWFKESSQNVCTQPGATSLY